MTANALPGTLGAQAHEVGASRIGVAAWPLAGIGLVLACQLTMVFTRAVNWDEFWFYYHVADFARGNLAQPLQSLHVRLFAWLPGVADNSVDGIVIARLFMLACEAITLLAIYAIARRIVDRPVALLAALLYVSAGFVLQHGFSFRTDPMVTAALMAALAILARAPLSVAAIAATAALIAVAGMISMKAVLLAPCFAGLAWLRWSEARFTVPAAVKLAAIPVAAVALFAALYTWHSSALTADVAGVSMAAGASRWMFFIGIPPYWQMAVKAVLTAPVLFILAFAAPFAIWRSDLPGPQKWAATGLWLPLLLPFVYTNTAAYFYAFMLAPVAVGSVIALQAALRRYSVPLVTAVVVVMAIGIFAIEDRSTIDRQRSVVSTVETLLPPETAYFDHNGMAASLVKANWLVTPAGLADYRIAGIASYLAAMEAQPVPLLLANDDIITDMLAGDDRHFLPADAEVLRGQYQPFWGPIRLAGFAVEANRSITVQALVPGTYTVMDGPLAVNGIRYEQGALVEIARGPLRLTASENAARLQWGDSLQAPTQSFDDGPLYVGF
ncbi:glycosyltransferase family 39 protein [Aurantiacibacter gangjinensis]|uniref:Glycosyltransferase RgtA/B/C/D-like domain-containing protein n=1 Tax=Aurantiacibacter gangjinensis TaxID=502682 RepID=A0A0G9MR63_9SPHN|nr:glycosyltransferase family 39 protein [Aurantiacibacter gangjinensis]APE29146.1 hypothetical protein BMF35_a2317 [Aurantiacibacter gangjinensis]KLE33221.1 hypothetical protein AAW01_04465 [Aurantiacibacter gangjinensis]